MSAVAVVGNLSLDRVAGGGPRAGGAAYHCARALGALDVEAVVVTKSRERWLVEAAEELGVPVAWRETGATAAFAIDYDGDSRRMVVEALGDPWTPEEARGWVADALGETKWVHAAPLTRTDFPPETLEELARGRKLSYDGQGLVRRAAVGRLALDGGFDPALLARVSILKLSQEEADVVGLEHPVPEVLVTRGSRGAVVHVGGVRTEVRAQVVSGVDPTGAGDMFAAVYLVARAGGDAPVAAAERACAVVAELLA